MWRSKRAAHEWASVDILLLLAIAGILAVVAVPSLRQARQSKRDASTRMSLPYVVKYCRDSADPSAAAMLADDDRRPIRFATKADAEAVAAALTRAMSGSHGYHEPQITYWAELVP